MIPPLALEQLAEEEGGVEYYLSLTGLMDFPVAFSVQNIDPNIEGQLSCGQTTEGYEWACLLSRVSIN